MKYFKQLGLLLFAADSMLRAQNKFNKAIDNPNYLNGVEFAYSLLNIADTSYVISTSSWRFPNNENSLLFLVTDTLGFVSTFNDVFTQQKIYYTSWVSSLHFSQNYIFVCGSVQDINNSTQNALLVRYNFDFDTVFIKEYSDSSINSFNSYILTENESILLTGISGGEGTGEKNLLIQKLDINGNEIWKKLYGDNQDEEGYNIIEYSQYKYMVFGKRHLNNIQFKPWILKIDSSGNIIDSKWYNCNNSYCAGGVHGFKGFDDKIYVRGYLDTIINTLDTPYPAYIGTIDTNFNITILKVFNDSVDIGPYNIKQIERDSSFIAIGYKINAPGSNQTLGWICKVDKNANILWEREYYYKNEVFNYFSDFQPTADGDFIITGATNGDTSQDIWLVKLDSLGLLNDSLIVNSGTVLANSSTNILQLYPNPAKEQLHLKIFFTQKQNTTATLIVYDMLGKQIISENIQLQQGKANHSINVSNLPGGNYIAIVQAGGEAVKQRFMRE